MHPITRLSAYSIFHTPSLYLISYITNIKKSGFNADPWCTLTSISNFSDILNNLFTNQIFFKALLTE